MALIKGGTFKMGTDDGFPYEGPAHDVTLKSFWIDRHEVTVAKFGEFVTATGYKTEAEKFGVLAETGEPLPFEGERSVRRVLNELQSRFGWSADREYAEGDVIALHRDAGSITLEPGGQLELSGAPLANTHATCREFRRHMAELREICEPIGIVWLSLGFHPFARLPQHVG